MTRFAWANPAARIRVVAPGRQGRPRHGGVTRRQSFGQRAAKCRGRASTASGLQRDCNVWRPSVGNGPPSGALVPAAPATQRYPGCPRRSSRRLNTEELELEVYPADVHSSTMRAEMAWLRALLGADVVQSRPYRLIVETDCDWHAVTAHLAAGRLRDAVRTYHGPLLPQSDAPRNARAPTARGDPDGCLDPIAMGCR